MLLDIYRLRSLIAAIFTLVVVFLTLVSAVIGNYSRYPETNLVVTTTEISMGSRLVSVFFQSDETNRCRDNWGKRPKSGLDNVLIIYRKLMSTWHRPRRDLGCCRSVLWCVLLVAPYCSFLVLHQCIAAPFWIAAFRGFYWLTTNYQCYAPSFYQSFSVLKKSVYGDYEQVGSSPGGLQSTLVPLWWSHSLSARVPVARSIQ